MAGELIGIGPSEVLMIRDAGSINPFRITGGAIFLLFPVNPFNAPS